MAEVNRANSKGIIERLQEKILGWQHTPHRWGPGRRGRMRHGGVREDDRPVPAVDYEVIEHVKSNSD